MPRANPKARSPLRTERTSRSLSFIIAHENARTNPNRQMTEKQKALAKALAMPGMTQSAAGRMAGYGNVSVAGMVKRLLVDPAFVALLDIERKAFIEASSMTRKRVIDGFLRAVELSEMKTDSIAMTAAWREIGRLCGYYAPKVIQHKVSVDGEAFKERLQQMTEDELMRLGSGEDVLEGEFEITRDGNVADSIRDDLTSVR